MTTEHNSVLLMGGRTGQYVAGGVGGGGQRGHLPPPGKFNFFSNIVFEFAELFLVAILLRNHNKIDN